MKMRDEDGDLYAEPVTMQEYLGLCDRKPCQRLQGSAFDADWQRFGRWIGVRTKTVVLNVSTTRPGDSSATVKTEPTQWMRFDSKAEAEAFLDRITAYQEGR